MLRLNKHPIGDSNPLYETYDGVLERPNKPTVDVIVKVLRDGKSEADEDAFENLFAHKYKAADVGNKVVYYRNYIQGETLKGYLSHTQPDDDTIMSLSNKLLAFLNFLHIEKQYHNKLNAGHILLQDNQIYLISGNKKLYNTPQKDIEAFGNVLKGMLKGQKEIHPFYKDVLEKCAGEGDYFRTISDVLYRFKNRVKTIEGVPESFDRYALEELNKSGFPPTHTTREAIKDRAYRMVIDDELVNHVIRRNSDKVVPIKKGMPKWAWLLVPALFIIGLSVWKNASDKSNKTKQNTKIEFDLEGDMKREMGRIYRFNSNAERGKNLLWKVYDYSGRKITQQTNKASFDFIPEKPGKYFVTLENVVTPAGTFKDTIEVLWPGGKAQFEVEQLSDHKFRVTNRSPFADSAFYDMGDGLKKMTTKSIEYEYTNITEATEVDIQFAAYANGQADLQTKTFKLKVPNKAAPSKPKAEPENTAPIPKSRYKIPIIRVMAQNYKGKTIGFRLSSASYDKRLKYEWEVSGETKKGRIVRFSTVGQNVMQVRLRATKDGKIIHNASKLVTVQKQNEKVDSPFQPIEGTDLFKDN